jgi:hypothetical protein
LNTLDNCLGWTVAVSLIGAVLCDGYDMAARFVGLAVAAMVAYGAARVLIAKAEGAAHG